MVRGIPFVIDDEEIDGQKEDGTKVESLYLSEDGTTKARQIVAGLALSQFELERNMHGTQVIPGENQKDSLTQIG